MYFYLLNAFMNIDYFILFANGHYQRQSQLGCSITCVREEAVSEEAATYLNAD